MRTTVNIDDDVLIAVRAIAEQENRTLGQVLSILARAALPQPPSQQLYRNGFPILQSRSERIVTLEMVNGLRDEDP